MCGISGVLFKNGKHPDLKMTTGEAVTEMMHCLLHRGPDSDGWAMYKEPLTGASLRMRFFVSEDKGEAERDVARIRAALAQHKAKIVEEERIGITYGAIVQYKGDSKKFAHAVEDAARLVSFGRSLDIVKDVGQPQSLGKLYRTHEFDGTHAIGHTRLATETGVHPETTHPFWATGFEDVCVVHNGQVTNYWVMRRRLERQGMRFHTENDTELIAVYLAYRMDRGATFEEALRGSLDDLDGTFTYLVATKDSIGYAKDKLAAKPLVIYEDEHMVAVASEEVSLNRLFPGRSLKTWEPAPLTYGLWTLAKPALNRTGTEG
ncbi:MAG: class II glutamine amidotransferase [Deltaproteobacteria bacterium]|nr:class II glutamine amidotransferase [Deltaproteobacteria bacterium]